MSRRTWLIALAFVLLAVSAGYFTQRRGTPTANATFAPLEGTPEALIATYVEGDFAGERLEAASWLKYQPMVAWPNEPNWHSAYVIKSYALQPATRNKTTLEARVAYDTLGELDLNDFRYTPSPTTHTVPYLLEPHHGAWRIAYPMLKPHPGTQAAVAFLERMRVGHPARREAIDRAIAAIRADSK